MATDFTRGPAGEFQVFLSELKASGSNLLVTGDVTAGVRATCSRTMFSNESQRHRKRILALAASDAAQARDYFADSVSFDTPATTIIDIDLDAERNSETRSLTDAYISTDDLQAVQLNLTRTIKTYESEFGGLKPAQLRFGMDSLDCLPSALDDVDLLQMLRSLRMQILDARGLAHYHVALPDSDPHVQNLWETGIFDARVELRKRDNMSVGHRWHAPDLPTTKWVGLS